MAPIAPSPPRRLRVAAPVFAPGDGLDEAPGVDVGVSDGVSDSDALSDALGVGESDTAWEALVDAAAAAVVVVAAGAVVVVLFGAAVVLAVVAGAGAVVAGAWVAVTCFGGSTLGGT